MLWYYQISVHHFNFTNNINNIKNDIYSHYEKLDLTATEKSYRDLT